MDTRIRLCERERFEKTKGYTRFPFCFRRHYPALRKEGAENMSTKYDALMAKGWPKNIVVEKAYAGPTLGDEITMDCMYDLTALDFGVQQTDVERWRFGFGVVRLEAGGD